MAETLAEQAKRLDAMGRPDGPWYLAMDVSCLAACAAGAAAIREVESLRVELARVTGERDEALARREHDDRRVAAALEGIADAAVRADAAIAKSASDAEYAQTAVEFIVWYRNLAISLGAKPDDMKGEEDRRLCATGLGEDVCWSEWRAEQNEAWAVVDIETARADAAEKDARLNGEAAMIMQRQRDAAERARLGMEAAIRDCLADGTTRAMVVTRPQMYLDEWRHKLGTALADPGASLDAHDAEVRAVAARADGEWWAAVRWVCGKDAAADCEKRVAEDRAEFAARTSDAEPERSAADKAAGKDGGK